MKYKLRLKTKISFSILLLASLFLLHAKNALAITLDPNNPGGRPNPQTLVDAGITQVRVVLKNDQTTIAYVNELKASGINVIGIINWEYNSQAWANSGQLSQNYINNFSSQIINDAYQNFGQLFAYQVWNEPDGTQGGSISIDANSYAQLLASVNARLKALNGSQIVISAGLVSGNLDYLQQMLNSQWGFSADGVALHAYNDPTDPNSINAIIAMIQALSSMTGTHVWITEFGWETSNLAQQAAWLSQVYALRDNPQTAALLQTVMWYAFSDAQNPGFGLFNIDGTPKPAFFVLLAILQGHPLSAEALANLLAGILTECTNQAGTFIGYGIDQAYCDSLVECKDSSGNLIGYAPLGLCQIQEDIKNTCGGPIDVDLVGFKTEIAGPWRFISRYNVKDVNDLENAENVLSTKFIIETVGNYKHFDLQPIAYQLVGSSESGFYDIQTRVNDMRAPAHLNSRIPGYTYPASFMMGAQDYQKATETETDYTKRLFSTSTSSLAGKEKYGERAKMDSTPFNACIQRLVCNPEAEKCLKVSYDFNDPANSECVDGVDDPKDCVSYGQQFRMNGQLSFEEPADLLAVSKELDYLGQMYSDTPKSNGSAYNYNGKQDNDLSSAKNTKINTATNNTKPISSLSQLTSPQKAVAANSQPGNYQSISAGATPNGDGTYNVFYRYCVSHVSPCGLGDISSNINGAWSYNWGSSSETGSCLEGGWGEAPVYNNVTLPITITASSQGRWVGDEAHGYGQDICRDRLGPIPCTVSIVNGLVSSSCGNLPPPPPVDCRNCESWASPNQCAKIIERQLPTADECADGKCQIDNVDVEKQVPLNENGFTVEFDQNSGSVFSVIWNWLLNAFGLTSVSCVSQGDRCDNGTNILDGSCASLGCTDSSCTDRPGKFQCLFNASEYILYAYPTQLIGDYGDKAHYTRVLESLYKIPGITDKYFDKKSAMAPLELKLTNTDVKASTNDGEVVTDGLEPTMFEPKPNTPSTQTINVEYFDFTQPLFSSVCLQNAFGSLPDKFPTDLQNTCASFDFIPGGARVSPPLTPIDPTQPPNFPSGDVASAIGAAASDHSQDLNFPRGSIPESVLQAILETEAGTTFVYDRNVCDRNAYTATGPMQITDGTVTDNNFTTAQERTDWGIRTDWNATPDHNSDGRCDINYAMEIAARILQGKANEAVSLGIINNNDLNNVNTAMYAAGGYYGTRTCQPTADTQAWGVNISYCDFFMFRLGQCPTLAPSCDGIGPGIDGQTKAPSSQAKINQNQYMTPINWDTPSIPVNIQIQNQNLPEPKSLSSNSIKLNRTELMTKLEEILNKYKDQITIKNPTINDLPPAMVEELKALAKEYE